MNAAERSRVSFLTLPRKGHPGLGESDPVELIADTQRQEMGGKGQAKSHFLFVVLSLTLAVPPNLFVAPRSPYPCSFSTSPASTHRCLFDSPLLLDFPLSLCAPNLSLSLDLAASFSFCPSYRF